MSDIKNILHAAIIHSGIVVKAFDFYSESGRMFYYTIIYILHPSADMLDNERRVHLISSLCDMGYKRTIVFVHSSNDFFIFFT